tara:strand:+ start:52 stop:897 length:846 start_codon:yes stop_codon:yes gene_type:complete
MNDIISKLNNIRIEITFKSYDELRLILSFCQENNLYKINIPCKNNLKKDFLLGSIKICKNEFSNIDIIPHFSIFHEFRRNRLNTQNAFIEFLIFVRYIGCNQVLLVSGSQKRSTLDSVSALYQIKDMPLFQKNDFSIGVAFNPYLQDYLFEEEILRLKEKLESDVVTSIWLQFGTDYKLLESRILIIKNIIYSYINENPKISEIMLFGSILIPSKQFLSRFKYRPWKGVYCSLDFLESVELANNLVAKLLKIYWQYKIQPIIETNVSTKEQLNSLNMILNL